MRLAMASTRSGGMTRSSGRCQGTSNFRCLSRAGLWYGRRCTPSMPESPCRNSADAANVVTVGDAEDQRNPDADLRPCRQQPEQVVEDRAHVHARGLPVQVRVHGLEVVQEEVGLSGDFEEHVGRGHARGVHGAVDAPLAARPQYVQEELPLEQRLTSGERDAAAGLLVEDPVLLDLGHDLVDGVTPPDEATGLGGARGWRTRRVSRTAHHR